MADNELVIILKLDTTQADQQRDAFNTRMRQAAQQGSAYDVLTEKQTSDQKAALDKERLRSVQENIAARVKFHKAADAELIRDAKQFSANLAKIRQADSEAARREVLNDMAVRKQALSQEAQIEKGIADSVAAANKRTWDEEAARRKVQLADLQAAIKSRYAEQESLARATVSSETQDRKKQLNDLKSAIIARYAEQDKADEAYVQSEKGRANALAAIAKRDDKERRDQLRQQAKEARNASSAIMSIATAYTALRIAAEIGQAVRAVMMAIGQSTKDARDYVHGLVEEMEKMRDRTAEILAMRGKQASGIATAGIAAEAQAASVEVPAYLKFTEELQAQIQQHIGAGPEFRITEDQSKLLSGEAMTFAASQGIKPEAAAMLLGTAVETTPRGPDGKVSNEAVMNNYAKLLKTMQIAKGRTSPLLPQFAEVAAELVGDQGDYKDVMDAAVVFRTMASINPKKASTFTRALSRGMRQIRMKEVKADELGITKDMNFEQAMAQAVKQIPEIAKAEGVSEDEVTSRYFNEIREFGAFKGFVGKGIKEGGFARARADIAGTGRGFITEENQKYRESARGKRAGTLAGTERAKLERASRYEGFRQIELEAIQDLTQSGMLEDPEGILDALMTKSGEQFGQGNRQEQEVRRLAIERLRKRGQETAEGRRILRDQFTRNPMSARDDQLGNSMGTMTPISELNKLEIQLTRIAKSNEEMEKREKMTASGAAMQLMGFPNVQVR